MDFRGADMQAAEACDRLAAKDAEIKRLRAAIRALIEVYVPQERKAVKLREHLGRDARIKAR